MGIQLTKEQSCRIYDVYDIMNSFLMSIEEIYTSPSLGIVITGDVEKGTVCVGSWVAVIKKDGRSIPIEIKEIIQEKQSVQYPEWDKKHRISLRFDLHDQDMIQEGDVIAGWTGCNVTPWDGGIVWD